MRKAPYALPRLFICRWSFVLIFSLVYCAGCSVPQMSQPRESSLPSHRAAATALNDSLGTAATQPLESSLSSQRTTVTTLNESLGTAATQSSDVATDYRLGPDDLIQISFYNIIKDEQEEVLPKSLEVRMSHSGDIALPLIGKIHAIGLTAADLERELHQRYRKYILDPQVSVHVHEYHSQRVSVFGAVLKPGVFELSTPKTVVDMLALAGGLNEKAGRQVHLSRQGQQGRESYIIDLHALTVNPAALINRVVYGGDVITVPRADSFFVDGAVEKPGSYLLDRPYTLTQALATAGGVNQDLANSGATKIFRGHLETEAETLTVDVQKILAGEIANPEIYADDVIVVPVSMPKYIVKRFLGAIGMGIGIPLR